MSTLPSGPAIVMQTSQPVVRARRIGILNDYVRIPFANGSSFASQFLCREFVKRGHHVALRRGLALAGAADDELRWRGR